ncbi:MAG: precorrin-6y C5,15-methyltransferase (decarboxylating) subunit CbiE [Calothrix sp. C42_A2020_038]|nr:precorrin-6y C5,15-methyltransferase (decarboxylating) subunit CbiE [Calothrix sp. C42_A2020_038]
MKWLSVVGIGEDGLAGLGKIARSFIDQAEVLVGGRRHLAMLPSDKREKLVWMNPIQQTVEDIIHRRPKSVCVLASGDPMCFGIGVTLTRFISISEITIIPAPSAFSLACARLGWSLSDVETFSLCGRPVELARSYFYSGAKLLILSADKHTPEMIANMLVKSGFSNSKITILERMGGVNERIITSVASYWNNTIADLADLNTVAVECIVDAGVTVLSKLPGLPDDAYHHDGQLTKREVRAVTLATLAPKPGEVLWDIGAGCGSISIEWMRTHPLCRAVAIEQNSSRLKYISDNAANLGTPYLEIILGKAPDVLVNLLTPNVIFIGGGVTSEGVLETCWQALPKYGRLVANVVTIEGEQKLFEWYQQFGGHLSRIAIQRAEPIGKFMGWKAMAPVTQWAVVKS